MSAYDSNNGEHFFTQEPTAGHVQSSEEHEQNPAHSQNITYSEAVKLNTDIVQTLETDAGGDAQPMAVNKIEESVTVTVDTNTPMPPKPVQVRKISRFQVSHVQEDNIPKINAQVSSVLLILHRLP